LYGYETWSVALREEYKLKLFKRRRRRRRRRRSEEKNIWN
jgi:hypothetical protein